MAREAKPWFRKQNQTWYVQLDGRQHNLGRDKEKAFERYHELMLERKRQPARPADSSPYVYEIIDRFVIWCQNNRAPKTAKWYKEFLEAFLAKIDPDWQMTVDQLTPAHVTEWVDNRKRKMKASSKRGAMIAVQRCFTWAVRQGLIKESPVRHLEKPMAERRECYVSPATFEQMMSHVKRQEIRDLLAFAFYSGARPQEIRMAEARHYDERLGALVLPPKEAKGKRRTRVIYLNTAAKEIIERLKHSEGKLFKNTKGRAWTPVGIDCVMKRLAEKMGTKLPFYALRHGRATALLEAGVDHLTVAAILGHSDGSTLAKVYSHLNDRAEHLKKALEN